MNSDEYEYNEVDAPLPVYSETPWGYRIHIVPVAPRKKTEGGIILPDQARDAENFMNALGRIVKVGWAAFHPRAWQNYGGVPEEHRPQVGEVIRFSGTHNRKFFMDNTMIISINDNMIEGAGIDPEDVARYRFHR